MTTAHPTQQVPGHSGRVRAYYEQNSAWFHWLGLRRQTQAIHRPVWAAGIHDRQAALNHVNACIAAQARERAAQTDAPPLRFVDLGCGYGGTLQYLARALGPALRGVGVTVSAHQAQTARHLAHTAGLDPAPAFVEADFHAAPLGDASMDVACSVEAFAHSGDPARYIAEAARLLKRGGRLILCDDFRADTRPDATLSATDRRWLAVFKTGWHVPHLLSANQLTLLAQTHGLHLRTAHDFSPALRIRTFPDALLPLFEQAVQPRGNLSALAESVVGGWALEHAIRRGLVTDQVLVVEKS